MFWTKVRMIGIGEMILYGVFKVSGIESHYSENNWYLLFLFITFDSVVEMDFDYFIKCVELFGLSFGVKFEGIRCFGRKLGGFVLGT